MHCKHHCVSFSVQFHLWKNNTSLSLYEFPRFSWWLDIFVYLLFPPSPLQNVSDCVFLCVCVLLFVFSFGFNITRIVIKYFHWNSHSIISILSTYLFGERLNTQQHLYWTYTYFVSFNRFWELIFHSTKIDKPAIIAHCVTTYLNRLMSWQLQKPHSFHTFSYIDSPEWNIHERIWTETERTT